MRPCTRTGSGVACWRLTFGWHAPTVFAEQEHFPLAATTGLSPAGGLTAAVAVCSNLSGLGLEGTVYLDAGNLPMTLQDLDL